MNSYQQGLAAFQLFVVATALTETVILSRRRPGSDDWRAYWASLGVAVGRRLTDLCRYGWVNRSPATTCS